MRHLTCKRSRAWSPAAADHKRSRPNETSDESSMTVDSATAFSAATGPLSTAAKVTPVRDPINHTASSAPASDTSLGTNVSIGNVMHTAEEPPQAPEVQASQQADIRRTSICLSSPALFKVCSKWHATFGILHWHIKLAQIPVYIA